MKLILFRGRPGTGKTLLSGLLSAQLNLPVIRKDDIYDGLSTLNPDHQQRNSATHHILYAVLKSNAPTTSTLLLDFPFQFDDDIAKLKNWCIENNVELKSIVVTCSDEELWASRFNKRAENPAPNQLITDFKLLKQRYGEMQLRPGPLELLIDTVNNSSDNIKNIIAFITK
ncbi:AAA family ATPase [Mucilaginibacter paludis]|uniref:Uncharacterized protein n=1 Tax=Mucilaginibacter paludis DSM 18603 TaxID=714943 RepID=H1Y9D4_9SPHI|nr:AAA family ATPase [Mucilaginibacter paludis]EHQ29939.1 hypothetical protein Mucpa_5873 [Mucilaginibacter paludis DSM 18603]